MAGDNCKLYFVLVRVTCLILKFCRSDRTAMACNVSGLAASCGSLDETTTERSRFPRRLLCFLMREIYTQSLNKVLPIVL